MNTPDEYAGEEDFDRLYKEITKDVLEGGDALYDKVINQFTSGRLQSYYVAHPETASGPLLALKEAEDLLAEHPSAALVFAVAATEAGVKQTLMKPILHGLVHSDFAAGLVAEFARDHSDKRFHDLFFAILNEYGGIDLKSFKRDGSKETLWDERSKVRKLRNDVVHEAKTATAEDAVKALGIATVILRQIFPDVISNLGLHLHDGVVVYGKKH